MIKNIKYFRIFLICIVTLSCDHFSNNREKEIEFILKNISTSSYFISIDVMCGEELFSIVIENNSFYDMLLQKRIINSQNDYISLIKKHILKNKPIDFNAGDKSLIESYLVLKNDSLNDLLINRKVFFMNNYFYKNKLKTTEISFDLEKAIIYYLFKNGIYCKRDDLSGNIYMMKLQ